MAYEKNYVKAFFFDSISLQIAYLKTILDNLWVHRVPIITAVHDDIDTSTLGVKGSR